MTGRMIRVLLVVAAVATVISISASDANAQVFRTRTAGDMYQNYTVGGDYCDCNVARMYVAPQPVPPVVGYTYYTYPALMPHEFMYPHSRHYIRLHNNSRPTYTKVLWW